MNVSALFNDSESRELDRITIRERGISGISLMGFAALSVFKGWEKRLLKSERILILCGSGNNGGDGYALAQFLKAEGCKVEIFSKAGNLSDETLYYKKLTESLRIPTRRLADFRSGFVKEGDILIDALLGTGFQGSLEGEIAAVVREISDAKERLRDLCFVLSIDAVSGFNPESALPFPVDGLAEIGSPKLKNLFYPLEEENKTFHPIGFLREEFPTSKFVFRKSPEEELRERLVRERDSHKYKNGSAVFFGGSEGMSGAILSSALAFQELGGGISQIMSPSPHTLQRILKKDPSFMVGPVESGKDPLSGSFAKKARVIALGPGLSSTDAPKLAFPKNAKIILDAGAITTYSSETLGPDTILTPHLGEWSSLQGKDYPGIYGSLEDASAWSKNKQCYLLLKGSVSVLFTPEGKSYFWDYPEPKLAVMGTGDLLVGILAFFLSRGEEMTEAVRLSQSVLLYCARACKGYPTAGRMRKKIRDLVEV